MHTSSQLLNKIFFKMHIFHEFSGQVDNSEDYNQDTWIVIL